MAAEKPSRVLVTGGRGFIGRAVVKLLQRHGYHVISIDKASAGEEESDSHVELFGDICDYMHMQQLFERTRIDGIVHLAAILPTAAIRDPSDATFVNIGGSHVLLNLAKKFGVRRFVFGSSLSVYGTYPADHVVTEMDRAAPEDLYGTAKFYVEQLGAEYRKNGGPEFVALRIGRVVGAGAESSTSPWRSQIFELLGTADSTEISIPYASTERILLAHVEDVAKMLVTLLVAERTGHCVYNAVCESVVVGELKEQLERLNPRLRVELGGEDVVGNPRSLDSSRFAREFGFESVPVFDLLSEAAGQRK